MFDLLVSSVNSVENKSSHPILGYTLNNVGSVDYIHVFFWSTETVYLGVAAVLCKHQFEATSENWVPSVNEIRLPSKVDELPHSVLCFHTI